MNGSLGVGSSNGLSAFPQIQESERARFSDLAMAAAGFPTEATWHGAVKNGNYASWPWLNPKNVRAHFPEYEETQKGHLKNQRQHTQSMSRPAKRRSRVDNDNVNTTV